MDEPTFQNNFSSPAPRRVSAEMVGVIFAIVMQCGIGVWWASGISSRLEHLETITQPLANSSMITTITHIDDRTTEMQRRVDAMSEYV